MNLPLRLTWDKASDRWAALLNPVLSSQSATPTVLPNVVLKTGANSVNHLLGKKLTGWSLSRIRASAVIYDTQDTNQMPELTLNLVTSGNVTVDLLVW